MSSRSVSSLILTIYILEGVTGISAPLDSVSGHQSIAVTSAAAVTFSGRKVMRREDGAPEASTGKGTGGEWQPISGLAPQDIEEETEQAKHHTKGHHTKGPTCHHGHCPAGKKLKLLNERPLTCAGDQCTAEECCVGMCYGFSCPVNTTEPIHDATCSNYTCTADQCCLGLCSQLECPEHAVKMQHDGSSPKKCKGLVCAAEECCVGTCSGTACPANTITFVELPKTCKSFPCEPDECCGGVCHESLCSSGKIPNSEMQARFAKSHDLRNVTSPDCSGLNCQPEECCVGTCSSLICDGTVPKRPLLVPGPESCLTYDCQIHECCAGLCKHEDCANTGLTTFLKEDAMPCSAGVCKAEECCVGKCSDQNAMCSSERGFKVHDERQDSLCTGIACSEAECCVGLCSDGTCGENYLLKPDASSCGAHVCSREECCLGQCTSGHCLRSKGQTLKQTQMLPLACSLAECTTEECCEALGTCSSDVCLPGNVTKSNPPPYCAGNTCTDAECCTKPGVCVSSTCTSLAGFVLKGQDQVCAADICTQEECCHQQRMVYWVENEKQTGKIRGCGIFGKCQEHDIRTIRSNIHEPEGLAFDAKHNTLYWCDTGNNKILRCRPEDCSDGKIEVVDDDLQNLKQPFRLAFDEKASKLYWVERQYQDIWRMDVVTSQRSKVVDNAIDLYVDSAGQMLYWISYQRDCVMRCSLKQDHCASEHVYCPSPATNDLYGIAVDAKRARLFWGRQVIGGCPGGGSHCSRIEYCPSANCTDAKVKTVSQDVNLVRGLSYDAVSSTLYIADSEQAGVLSKIRTCELPGVKEECVSTKVLLQGLSMPFAVAFDWTEETVNYSSRSLPDWATKSGGDPHVSP
eukprot:CAMPEP_0169099290 /NCGR_PEP_ID=MMETSP1015-20121227/20481_1 /TAXON_ID=342587 /ORGANISM="Karlodinium micrum, Strain CCMP2283" /LENGTH=858 /DNA_ID=CAMNT_0009160167 /DNA_START=155 /DNA_END=2731 /DNA_ORIENTATION=+